MWLYCNEGTMKPVVIGGLVLVLAVFINMQDLNVLDDILGYPIPAPKNIKKRDTSEYLSEDINEYIVEKLAEHTQALEYIVKAINHQEELIKKLIDHLSKTLEPPKIPIKIDPQRVKQQTRRNNEVVDNPVLKAGKNMPIYGKLATDLFLKEIHSDSDPVPLVEIDPLKPHRRSFDMDQETDQNRTESSPWCEIAMLCKKSINSVCGFDDNFGYGQFDNICHMLHVNCYYKYNFVLAHTCHPTIRQFIN